MRKRMLRASKKTNLIIYILTHDSENIHIFYSQIYVYIGNLMWYILTFCRVLNKNGSHTFIKQI